MLKFLQCCWIVGIAIILLPHVCVARIDVENLIIGANELPEGCKSIEGVYPVDVQTSILYDYKAYDRTLPSLATKKHQSLNCSGKKGTIFYFEYETEAQREHAEVFIRSVLWGGDRPTWQHPEEVLHSQNVLLVVSFRGQPKGLAKVIMAKFSAAEVLDTAGGILNVPDGVLTSYINRLGCGSADLGDTLRIACDWLHSFLEGDAPTTLLSPSSVFLGRSMNIEANDSVSEIRSEAFVTGAEGPGMASFFTAMPENSAEEGQLKEIVAAKATKAPIPKNQVLKDILQIAPSRESKVQRTSGVSLFLLVEGSMKTYVRRNGDRLYMVVPIGSSPEEYARNSFLVAKFI